MTQYFLGVDIGGTKSHALIADAFGNALGFGKSSPGNPKVVGYTGLSKVLHAITNQAIATAGIVKEQISGVGLGILLAQKKAGVWLWLRERPAIVATGTKTDEKG
jgi:N-acetylglucosamine kinase-like BadF-type ATPase